SRPLPCIVSVSVYRSHSPFFFDLHRHPCDRHSFPTRRSSDLRVTLEGARELRGDPARQPETDEPVVVRGASALLENLARAAVDQDRKSTRLNSSHVSISYAVFCLKKKHN